MKAKLEVGATSFPVAPSAARRKNDAIEFARPRSVPPSNATRFDRDRGEPRGSSPPTPPCVRVRTRRFGRLCGWSAGEGSEAEGSASRRLAHPFLEPDYGLRGDAAPGR